MTSIPTDNKLNTQRLKGPKGIETIEKYFEGFKFHGKNHEKHDLDRIMKRLEHWCYRLYPKYQFDDCLEKIEKLGYKKDLQVYLKKYRLNMLTTDDTDVAMEEVENTKKLATEYSPENTFKNIPEITPENIVEVSSQLTQEDRERIERNRQLAIERRLARMSSVEEAKKRKLEEHKDLTPQIENTDSFAHDIPNVSSKEGNDVRLQPNDLIDSECLNKSESQTITSNKNNPMCSTLKDINFQDSNCIHHTVERKSDLQIDSQEENAKVQSNITKPEEKSNVDSIHKSASAENDEILVQLQHTKSDDDVNLHPDVLEENVVNSKFKDARDENDYGLNLDLKKSLTNEELKLEIEAALDQVIVSKYRHTK